MYCKVKQNNIFKIYKTQKLQLTKRKTLMNNKDWIISKYLTYNNNYKLKQQRKVRLLDKDLKKLMKYKNKGKML